MRAKEGQSALAILLRVAQDEKWAGYLHTLPENDVHDWLNAVPGEQRQDYHQEGRDKLYDIACSVTVETPQFILRILQEIPLLPDQYNWDTEYQAWMDKAQKLQPRTELSPELPFLLGGRPDDVCSYWEATQHILDDNQDLFLIAVRHAVDRHSIPTDDIKVLIRIEAEGGEDASGILQEALLAKAVPRSFVGDLLKKIDEHGDGQSVLAILLRIAQDGKWGDYLRSLPANDVLGWLNAVPSEQRQDYYQEGRDGLYDIACAITAETPQFVLRGLQEIPTLPDQYDQDAEYQRWLDEARKLQLRKKLPPELLFLLRERPDDVHSYWEATQRILEENRSLFLITVRHAIACRSSIPTGDIKALIRLEAEKSADATEILQRVLSEDVIPQGLVGDLLREKGDKETWCALLRIAQDKKWNGYLNTLPEGDALDWLNTVPEEQRKDYHQEDCDRLYGIAFTAISESPQLALRVLQEVPSLPPQYDQNAEYRAWQEKARQLPQQELATQLLFLLGKRPVDVQSYWEATRRVLEDNQVLFLIAVRYAVEHRHGVPANDIKQLVHLLDKCPQEVTQFALAEEISKGFSGELVSSNPLDALLYLSLITDNRLRQNLFEDLLREKPNWLNNLYLDYFSDNKVIINLYAFLKSLPAINPDLIIWVLQYLLPVLLDRKIYKPSELQQEYAVWIEHLCKSEPRFSRWGRLADLDTSDNDSSVTLWDVVGNWNNPTLFFLALHYAKDRSWENLEQDLERYRELVSGFGHNDPFGNIKIDEPEQRFPLVRTVLVEVFVIVLVWALWSSDPGISAVISSLRSATAIPTQVVVVLTEKTPHPLPIASLPTPTLTSTPTSTSTPTPTSTLTPMPTPIPATPTATPVIVSVAEWGDGRSSIFFTERPADDNWAGVAIYYFDARNKERQQVLDAEFYNSSPFYERRERLFFISKHDQDDYPVIYLMNLSVDNVGQVKGTLVPQRLVNDYFEYRCIQWSPDLSGLATICNGEDVCLYYGQGIVDRFYFDLDSNSLTRLSNFHDEKQSPSTPIFVFEWLDEETILFATETDAEIYSASLSTPPANQLPVSAFATLADVVSILDIGILALSDESVNIAVLAQSTEGGHEILYLNSQGEINNRWPLLAVFSQVFQIGWSPTGREIAFTASSDIALHVAGENSVSQQCDWGCMFVLDVDTGEISLITDIKNGVREFWWGNMP